MTNPSPHKIIVVEPRNILSSSIQTVLSKYYPSWQIRSAGSIEEAIQFAFEPIETELLGQGERNIVFVIGGVSYWEKIDYGKRILACLPNSRLIIIDDQAKLGCSIVVEQLPIQGFISLDAKQEDGRECLGTILKGELYISPRGRIFLEYDRERHALKNRTELRKSVPYTFTHRELYCFHLLVSGRKNEEIATALRMQCRSARNLKYRIMKKMGVKHFVDVLRLAHDWGLFDS